MKENSDLIVKFSFSRDYINGIMALTGESTTVSNSEWEKLVAVTVDGEKVISAFGSDGNTLKMGLAMCAVGIAGELIK